MNRQIKFRAWDSYQKRMLKVSRISFDGPIEGAQAHCYRGIILEQYTGLKDANGKEIYEGDIVHVVTEDGYERTGKVIFEKGCYWVDNGMDKYPVNRIGFERDTLEVLGNVHVNPNIIDFYDMKQL